MDAKGRVVMESVQETKAAVLNRSTSRRSSAEVSTSCCGARWVHRSSRGPFRRLGHAIDVRRDLRAAVGADGNGAETPVPLADYIEVGVFSGKKLQEKPLYVKKERFAQEHQSFEITVDEQPTLAGIDP
jgi:hypothetical protein